MVFPDVCALPPSCIYETRRKLRGRSMVSCSLCRAMGSQPLLLFRTLLIESIVEM